MEGTGWILLTWRRSSNTLAVEPLISWDCEGNSYSDARATETDQARPTLVFGVMSLPLSSLSFYHEYHPLPSASFFSAFPLILLC